MSNPQTIHELIAQNLNQPAEAPPEEIPQEEVPGVAPEDDGPDMEEIIDEAPEMGLSEEELRTQAREFLRSRGELAGSPDEVAEYIRSLQAPAPVQESPPDPMADIMAWTRGVQPYSGEGDFDEQAAFIAAQVAQNAAQQTISQVMEQVKAELDKSLGPIMQAVQVAQASQAEQAVREDLRGLNLDDSAIDATILHLQKMGPQAMNTYLNQDVFRETMQGYAQSKKRNTRSEELQRRQAAPPVDAIPAARDAGTAAPQSMPTSISQAVQMAASDPSWNWNKN